MKTNDRVEHYVLYDKREQLEQKFFAVVVKDLSDLIFITNLRHLPLIR